MGKKPSRDWDCDKDGHIPGSASTAGIGARKTWCLVCGKRLS